MTGDPFRIKPGASVIHNVVAVVEEYGVAVLPGHWDHEYVKTEVNVILRKKLSRAGMVTHPSLGPEGIVGAKVHILKLSRLELK